MDVIQRLDLINHLARRLANRPLFCSPGRERRSLSLHLLLGEGRGRDLELDPASSDCEGHCPIGIRLSPVRRVHRWCLRCDLLEGMDV